jgi:branched-chain amino acid transport system ATP-binding protein
VRETAASRSERRGSTLSSPAPLLRVSNVSIHYGGVTALDSLSFEVSAGELVALIGPNGAGKTTLFNCISRFEQLGGGEIFFSDQPLSKLSRHDIAKLGVSRTFQNLALFESLTIRDNLFVGAHSQAENAFLAYAFSLPVVRRQDASIYDEIDALLDFLDLTDCADRYPTGLPFGTLKKIELAKALAAKPRLLLLDEPAGGLTNAEVSALKTLIPDIQDRFQTTILLVEHHMNLVMSIADRVIVLDSGRLLADGPPEAIRHDPNVIDAYLGRQAV